MILADKCKQCGQFTFLGYINEYNERFCTKECYAKYCKKQGQDYADLNKLQLAEPIEE